MNLRYTFPVAALITMSLVMTGCGPTATGKKVRAEAQARLDSFGASFTYEQARQQFEAGQFDRAIVDADRAIAQAPERPEFHVLRGRILLEQQRLEAAMQSFQAAIEADATHAESHYYAGIVQQRWMRDEEALEYYRAAFDAERDNVHYLLACAETLINMGRAQEAMALVEGKLAYFEYDPGLKQLLGQIAMIKGDPVAASRLYEEARLLSPEDHTLLEELVWVQFDAGRYGDCLASTRRLLEHYGDRNDLVHLEARCLAMLGRSADAHRLYQTLVRQHEQDVEIWIEFGAVAWELGDERRLAQCGARAISLAPDRFEGFLYRGLVERAAGRLEDAAANFAEAARRADGQVIPTLLLGRTLEAAGRPDAALHAYRQVLKMDPSSDEARQLIAAMSTG